MSSKEPQELDIKHFNLWHVALRSNQNYLGWSLVILNRHAEDLMDITKSERDELFMITKKLRITLSELFRPDMFNYASLGNVVQHVHLQVIPRYKTPVNFQEILFTDTNWGRNYSPWDTSFHVSREGVLAIRNAIKSRFET